MLSTFTWKCLKSIAHVLTLRFAVHFTVTQSAPLPAGRVQTNSAKRYLNQRIEHVNKQTFMFEASRIYNQLIRALSQLMWVCRPINEYILRCFICTVVHTFFFDTLHIYFDHDYSVLIGKMQKHHSHCHKKSYVHMKRFDHPV